MEKEVNNKDWALIRNDNGEWISEEHAVFLTPLDATVLKARAGQQGKPLDIQHWVEGRLWCYRNQLESIDFSTQEQANRKLKIRKTMTESKEAYYHCESIYKNDKPFKRAARSKQSWFREEYLKVGFDPSHKKGKYGAFLLPEDAEAGLNFFEGFRAEILRLIQERYHKLTGERHDELFANMLRSEHIPWNVFVPMRENFQAAAKVFNDIIGKPIIDEITDIRIEWAPDKKHCLNDNTSFDAYIEFKHDGQLGGIGVEVKYTEEGYPIGKKEYSEVMENEQSQYALVTRNCGLFKQSIADKPIRETSLCKDEFRQIWRNHILGESMVMNWKNHLPCKSIVGDYMLERFYSITLYPNGNPHFNSVLPKYKEFLSEYGASTFRAITFESLIDLLRIHFPKEAKFQDWIKYLQIRYPF